MKKLFSLLLAVALIASLSVCAFAEPALKVAVVLAGATGDRSFYDSANDGLKKLVDAGKVEGTLIECKNDASMFTSNLISAAESNDVVVAVGWEFWDALAEYAPQLPDTKFIFIDNGLDGVGENLMSITYAQNEGSFLVGYIAGKLSTTGAKLANENVEVQVQYAGTYDDPAKGKELALALYDAGCDVVFQVASLTGEGVFEAAKERNLLAIGVDSDQKYIDPEHIACSMIKKVGESIETAINDLIDNGSWQGGQIWVADMSTGLVDVGYGDDTMPQQVSDELKAEVESIKQQIIGGEIEVPTAFN